MGFVEKIDALDMIIGVLKEHEKSLDYAVSRLVELAGGGEFVAQVVKHGVSLSITLPSKLVKKMNIKHGEYLRVNIRR